MVTGQRTDTKGHGRHDPGPVSAPVPLSAAPCLRRTACGNRAALSETHTLANAMRGVLGVLRLRGCVSFFERLSSGHNERQHL